MGWINKFDLISTENLERWKKLEEIRLYKKLGKLAENLSEEEIKKLNMEKRK